MSDERSSMQDELMRQMEERQISTPPAEVAELVRELVRELREFPQFMSVDGYHWLRSTEKEPLCQRAAALITKLAAQVAQLERGEFICRKCGIRKDGEHDDKPEF